MLKENTAWETLISVVIAIVIISIILIGLIKMLELDESMNFENRKINNITILEANTQKLITKLDTSTLVENDLFYLSQTGSEIQIFTGVINESYKFIDRFGNTVDSLTYPGAIFTRFCVIAKDGSDGQGIKCSIKEMIKK